MEAPRTYPLDTALRIALKIVEALKPMCDQVEIAGSIRRRRPHVGDIDLVVLPKTDQLRAIKARCTTNCTLVVDGDQNFIVRMPIVPGSPISGLQIDLFFARHATSDFFAPLPTNWGSLLLNRTGSTGHNIWLIDQAKRRDLTWNPYHGVFGRCPKTGRPGACLASATEDEIYAALGLPYLPPEHREYPALLNHCRGTAAARQPSGNAPVPSLP